jgi:hypothetical protein
MYFKLHEDFIIALVVASFKAASQFYVSSSSTNKHVSVQYSYRIVYKSPSLDLQLNYFAPRYTLSLIFEMLMLIQGSLNRVVSLLHYTRLPDLWSNIDFAAWHVVIPGLMQLL